MSIVVCKMLSFCPVNDCDCEFMSLLFASRDVTRKSAVATNSMRSEMHKRGF